MAGRERKVLEERVGRRLAETQVLLTKEVVLWNHGYLAMPQVPSLLPFLVSQAFLLLQYASVYERARVCAYRMSLCSSARDRLKTVCSKVPEAHCNVEDQ